MATTNPKITNKPETMLMSGVPVDFPYQPYPCQIAMLGKIIKALQQSKNCLLESPTGTGKTLTLLCAALSWQQKELEISRTSSNSNDSKDQNNESSNKLIPVSRIFYCTRTHKQLEQVAKQLNNTVYKDKIRMTLLSSRDNYCVHPTVSKGPNKNHECAKLTRPTRESGQMMRGKSECGFFERLRGKTAADFLRLSRPKQLPRIFDIEQFNEYCQESHAICPYYTSRLLINDVHIILCPYNYLIDPRVRNSMQMSLNNAVIIIDEAHNIEDCARESMKFHMRKYDYEAALEEFRVNQNALEMAQIQAAHLLTNGSGFSATQDAPVNSQMSATQQQSFARRVAGYSEYDEMNDEIDLLDHLNIDHLGHDRDQTENPVPTPISDEQDVANALKFLIERFTRMIAWFDSKDPRETYTFTPKELVEQWHQAKFIDRSIINIHKSATKNQSASKRGCIQDASRIRKSLSKAFVNVDYVKFSEETGYFLENLDLCLSVLYADDYQFMDDYKITLKTVPFEPSENALAQMQNSVASQSTESEDSNFINMTQKSTQFKRLNHQLVRTSYPLHTQQLNFYCLSPSVAFAKDLQLARSLIFASGTLAPLATYSGELKIPFDFQMECNHVIDGHRTFITALSHGRNPNVKLRATYQIIERLDFQDECGLVLLDICQRVPYGVLCFVPSYRFLNLIMNRWMSSGLWQKLNEYKSVFFEEKSSVNFQNTIDRFREANGTFTSAKPISAVAKRVRAMWKRKITNEATKPSNSPYFPIKGGLLLAVCRGRASEGIDFSDNNARCVITLGIPYPNLKDEEVVFKRDYNNEQNKRISQVMNGSDWYDSQAYRALNQALGRCIRHKDDWGALIIVDERIANSINDKHFGNKISLWIKQRLFVSRKYDETMNALEQFSQEMKTLDEKAAAEAKENEEKQKLIEEELNRVSSTLPTPTMDSQTTAQIEANAEKDSVKMTPRKWEVDILSDDENESKKSNENHSKTLKNKVFERFLAQRPAVMSPNSSVPIGKLSLTSTEKKTLSKVQHFIDLTDEKDDNEDDEKKKDPDFDPSMEPNNIGRPSKKIKLK